MFESYGRFQLDDEGRPLQHRCALSNYVTAAKRAKATTNCFALMPGRSSPSSASPSADE
ncbi:hypothetical protein ACU42Y_09945 [Proteus mirabilis]